MRARGVIERSTVTGRRRSRVGPGRISTMVATMLLGFATALPSVASAQMNMGGHQPKDEGQRIYEKANCVGCHKWHGGGGGSYGGPALSLRDTQLDRDELIEVVRCGRPHTGMPYHDRDAYKEHNCYGGLTPRDLGDDMPQQAVNFLRPKEIDTVVDYVLRQIKGKGRPTYQDCIDFFGAGARACDVYEKAATSSSGEK
jgi:mono/diheme cytochrome c family protein